MKTALARLFHIARAVKRSIFAPALWRGVEVRARWWFRARGISPKVGPHGLATPLVISVTSYPPRYASLDLSLKCLLMQSVRPDSVVLWIAHEDFAALPKGVIDLQEHGLSIRQCENWRPYKKLVPQSVATPEAAIVTADDDVYYARTWLQELVAAVRPGEREVLCHRAHKVTFDKSSGAVQSYARWQYETSDNAGSRSIFPTGVGGILYMPGILHPDFVKPELFQNYCPTNDDIWFFFMAARTGANFRKVGEVSEVVIWDGTQESALWNSNQLATGNDKMIETMISVYGNPWSQYGAMN